MSQTVSIIKVENWHTKHVYFTLEHPEIINDWDEVHEPVDYVLPEGYSVAKDYMNELVIYDSKNMMCDILGARTTEPRLVSALGEVHLKRVKKHKEKKN